MKIRFVEGCSRCGSKVIQLFSRSIGPVGPDYAFCLVCGQDNNVDPEITERDTERVGDSQNTVFIQTMITTVLEDRHGLAVLYKQAEPLKVKIKLDYPIFYPDATAFEDAIREGGYDPAISYLTRFNCDTQTAEFIYGSPESIIKLQEACSSMHDVLTNVE